MTEWLGVAEHVDSIDELKSYALLLDRLLVRRAYEPYLPQRDASSGEASGLASLRREAEFEYLKARDILQIGQGFFERPPTLPPSPDSDEFAREAKQRRHAYLEPKSENFVRASAYDCSRALAILFTARLRTHAVCIARPVEYESSDPSFPKETFTESLKEELSLAMDETMKVGEVVRLIVPHMPKPDDSTPWERIEDFRKDPDTRSALRGLRRWIGACSRSIESPRETAEELEYLIEEYKSFLRLHEIRFGRSLLEVVLVTSAEIVENVCKLRFCDLAKMPFRMKEKRIALLDAEKNAPGREVSYIIKANSAIPG